MEVDSVRDLATKKGEKRKRQGGDQERRTEKLKKLKRRHQTLIGCNSKYYDQDEVCWQLEISRSSRYYHARKQRDPTFHPGTHGGARHCCFSEDVRLMLEHRIAEVVRDNPLLYLKEIQAILEQEFPLKVNVWWIFRALARMNISLKIAKLRYQLKYTVTNLRRYIIHCHKFRLIDPSRIKYLDETSFSFADSNRRMSCSSRRTCKCSC